MTESRLPSSHQSGEFQVGIPYAEMLAAARQAPGESNHPSLAAASPEAASPRASATQPEVTSASMPETTTEHPSIQQLQAELSQAEDRMQGLIERLEQAETDSLMDIDNIIGYNRKLTDQLGVIHTDPKFEQPQANGEPYSDTKGITIIADICYLKYFNDKIGHAQGNEMLRQAAAKIKEITSKYNATIGRVGGDEVAIFIKYPLDNPPSHHPTLEELEDQVMRELTESLSKPWTDHEIGILQRAANRPEDEAVNEAELDTVQPLVAFGSQSGLVSPPSVRAEALAQNPDNTDSMTYHEQVVAADAAMYKAKASLKTQIPDQEKIFDLRATDVDRRSEVAEAPEVPEELAHQLNRAMAQYLSAQRGLIIGVPAILRPEHTAVVRPLTSPTPPPRSRATAFESSTKLPDSGRGVDLDASS